MLGWEKKCKNSLNIKNMATYNVYGTYMYHIRIGGLERVNTNQQNTLLRICVKRAKFASTATRFMVSFH